jgi:hypothetical protein
MRPLEDRPSDEAGFDRRAGLPTELRAVAVSSSLVSTASGPSAFQPRAGYTLDAIVHAASVVPAVTRDDLREGDCLVVETRNSAYSLCPLGDGTYSVVGGWFDKKGLSPCRVAVNGCTFGGRSISSRVLAAPGLFLEFANRVTTTRIQRVRVLRAASS